MDDRGGHDTPDPIDPTGPLSWLRGGTVGGISCDPIPGTTWCWKGGPGGPPTPYRITPDLPGLLPKGDKRGRMPRRSMYREGLELDQPLNPIHLPPCAGQDSGPVGE